MTKPEDFAEPADLLLHDLRRFLHDAADQQDVLNKIANVMGRSASHMKEQEGAQKRILHSIKKQIDAGVSVKIDADLRAHTSRIAAMTAPLMQDLQQAVKMVRHMIAVLAIIAFLGGLFGGVLGVFTALWLM